MAAPLLTIAIPVYNAAGTLGAALDSLLAQDYACWDASVVDDGSTDEVLAILESYERLDSRIHFVQQANAGTGAAMNVALDNAQGEYIARLDADDLLAPHYMSVMAEFIGAHPGFDIYSCNAWLVFGESSREVYADDPLDRTFVSMDFAALLRGDPYLFAGGALIRRELYEELGGFRPEIYCEDVDFWRRALANGARHIYCPSPLYFYNKGVQGQKSSDARKIREGIIQADECLLESGLLDDESMELVRQSIARNRERIEFGATVEDATSGKMEKQSQAFRSALVSALGAHGAELVLRAAHKLSWIAFPARLAVVRLAVVVARVLGERPPV